MSAVICASSGGSSPAAIGIIRVSGQGCFKMLDRVFYPRCRLPSEKRESARLYYGELKDGAGCAFDKCMAAVFRAPSSYTGEDMAEIYIHGSAAVISETLSRLIAEGCTMAEAGEFTKRAFLNGKMDLIDAEATADLIGAPTVAAAKNAVLQMDGKLRGDLCEIKTDLLGICAHYFAVCDYPDEEIDGFSYEETGRRLLSCSEEVMRISGTYEKGRYLGSGLPVAIIGRPNAGKSSLFNALSGMDRAIVTEEAGTTRDVIEQTVSLGGVPVRLMDTAGLRDAESKAERLGIERSYKAADDACAVLLVLDGTGDTEEDPEFLNLLEGKPMAVVVNKCDLPGFREAPKNIPPSRTVFRVSSKTGEGIEKLSAWISDKMKHDENEPLITSARQKGLLDHCSGCLRSAAEAAASGLTPDAFLNDVELAARDIMNVLGEKADIDLAAEVFSRFCVGK